LNKRQRALKCMGPRDAMVPQALPAASHITSLAVSSQRRRETAVDDDPKTGSQTDIRLTGAVGPVSANLR